jgi:SAM-dependent methyltransferase
VDVTRALLRSARDRTGLDALSWASSPLAVPGPVLELAPHATYLSGRPVRADPSALPLSDNAIDAAVLLLTLPVLADVDAAFAELRRVLAPSATLVALVPSAAPRSPADLRCGLRAVHRRGWPHRSALDGAGWLLAAADFAVLGDDRRRFTLDHPDEVALRAGGLWPPDGDRRPVPARLPVPLRRIVARR